MVRGRPVRDYRPIFAQLIAAAERGGMFDDCENERERNFEKNYLKRKLDYMFIRHVGRDARLIAI